MTTSPVFVDASGRRARWVERACWALALLCAAYVALVVVALVSPPGTVSLAIPGLGTVVPKTEPPPLTTDDGQGGTPISLLGSLPEPTARPPRGAAQVPGPVSLSPRPGATARPTPVPTPAATGRPSASPTTRPTAQPTPTQVRGTGRPTARPTPTHPSKTPPPHP